MSTTTSICTLLGLAVAGLAYAATCGTRSEPGEAARNRNSWTVDLSGPAIEVDCVKKPVPDLIVHQY
jgi:hypothetical protein